MSYSCVYKVHMFFLSLICVMDTIRYLCLLAMNIKQLFAQDMVNLNLQLCHLG